MTYVKGVWTDETLTEDARYNILSDAGTPINETVQIVLETPVAVAGTALTAARMNNIETGVETQDLLSAPGSVMRASGANIETLTANKTLVDANYALQIYTPTAARDVTLPAVASTNHPFYVINASATYALTVKNAGGATIGIVAISSSGSFASDAIAWHSFGGGGTALTKAAAADVATGTDDAKYVTSKAIKDSVNVPNVAPSTSGNVLTSNGTAWTSAAGVSPTSTTTLTNKRITKRVVSTTQSATPTINTDNGDIFEIVALAQAITSMTTNLSGTPVEGDMIEIIFKDNATARAITWGASYAASGNVALPTTTVLSVPLAVLFQWRTSAIWTATSVWTCIGVA